jgi:hypothetical protein
VRDAVLAAHCDRLGGGGIGGPGGDAARTRARASRGSLEITASTPLRVAASIFARSSIV